MKDLNLFRSTAGGKAGAVDGLNLFFGALLGANLGTMQGMPLLDYIKLILLLAATVMVIRMVSTSPRRLYMLAQVFLFAAILAVFLLVPLFQPKGMASADLHRLAATLAVWIAFVLAAEFTPTTDEVKP
jgi:hypothetical protein